MSGLKNSPFGKRLRAARQGQGSDDEGEQPRRKAPRGAVLFGASDPDLGAGSSTRSPSASPERRGRPRERDSRERERTYGDRFVPSRERGDMRATYNLLDESAAAPRRTAIPTESDAVKGAYLHDLL
jgi:cell division cycle 20-like protein 1 (cofactor of APC complex)